MSEQMDHAAASHEAQPARPVTRADLPLHCPPEGTSVWNLHPRVFLPIEQTGRAKCPYCGAEYVLVET